MNVIEYNELIDLILDIVAIPIIIITVRHSKLPYFRLFMAVIISIFLCHLFTIIESFILPDLFDFLEHFFFAVSALLFFLGIINYFIRTKSSPND